MVLIAHKSGFGVYISVFYTLVYIHICIFLLNILYLVVFLFAFKLSRLIWDLSTNYVLLKNGITNKVP